MNWKRTQSQQTRSEGDLSNCWPELAHSDTVHFLIWKGEARQRSRLGVGTSSLLPSLVLMGASRGLLNSALQLRSLSRGGYLACSATHTRLRPRGLDGGRLFQLFGSAENLVHFPHELAAMLDFFESLDAVSVNLGEIVKLVLQVVVFGALEDLGSNVIAKVIKHDVFVQLNLFARVLHVNGAKFFKLIFRHRFDSFLDDPRAVLLLAQLG